MIRTAPFWSVMVVLLSAVIMLGIRGDTDRVPPSTPLEQFPHTIDGWTSTDQPIAQEALDVLGKGFFLNRVYVSPQTGDDVGLLIAYFPTQRTGQSIHSPQNCLPGAGWSFQQAGTIDLPNPDGGAPHKVGDYLIANGGSQAEVLYWYKTEKRWIASDWVAKYYILLDSMRYRRTDAALIRVTTMVRPGEGRNAARQRAITFATNLTPLLPAYVPD